MQRFYLIPFALLLYNTIFFTCPEEIECEEEWTNGFVQRMTGTNTMDCLQTTLTLTDYTQHGIWIYYITTMMVTIELSPCLPSQNCSFLSIKRKHFISSSDLHPLSSLSISFHHPHFNLCESFLSSSFSFQFKVKQNLWMIQRENLLSKNFFFLHETIHGISSNGNGREREE